MPTEILDPKNLILSDLFKLHVFTTNDDTKTPTVLPVYISPFPESMYVVPNIIEGLCLELANEMEQDKLYEAEFQTFDPDIDQTLHIKLVALH